MYLHACSLGLDAPRLLQLEGIVDEMANSRAETAPIALSYDRRRHPSDVTSLQRIISSSSFPQ